MVMLYIITFVILLSYYISLYKFEPQKFSFYSQGLIILFCMSLFIYNNPVYASESQTMNPSALSIFWSYTKTIISVIGLDIAGEIIDNTLKWCFDNVWNIAGSEFV